MNKILPYVKLIEKEKDNSPLISVQFNVTNNCACKCVMCKKHEWKLGEVPLVKALKIIDTLNEMQVETLVFSGGDPLAYSELNFLIEKFNGKIGILTAGNIKKDETFWNFISEKMQKINWIRFSIDAYDLEKWKEIRGSSDLGYKFLNENLEILSKKLSETEKQKVRFNFCKLKGINENQEKKVENWAKRLGFNFMAHDVRVFKEYMHLEKHHSYLATKCIIPFVHCVIEADGSVFPCCDVMNENASLENVNFNFALGNLKYYDWDFKKLWNSNEARNQKYYLFQNRVKECETCPARYYECNIEYENHKGDKIFL